MALGHFQSHAVDSAGNVLAGATVTVTNELTGGLATLKSDYAGASSKANGAGFTTDSDGYFDFYTTGGFYKITVEKDGSSKTWRYVGVGTLSGYDLDILLNAKRKTVRAATTANITISTALNNADTLDGVTLATNDLVLVKDQTNKYENGIYVVGVTPARHSDFDTYNEHVGAWIAVSEGTTNASRLYVNTDNQGGTLNTTAINFTRVIPNGGSAPLDSPAFTGSFQLTGDISPTSLSADQDDYNPSGLSGAAVIRHDQDAERNINGGAGGADGRLIIDANLSTRRLALNGERASATAANRFATDIEIDPGDAALRVYDSTSSRWRWLAPRKKPRHIHQSGHMWPTIPHRPVFFADWANLPWLDPYLSLTRGSAAYRQNRKGSFESVPAGVPRFHSIVDTGETGFRSEGSRTNHIRNNSMQGATTGVIGSGGAVPTNWTASATGLSVEVVGTGSEDGIDYIDVKFSGTAGSTFCSLAFDSVLSGAFSTGNPYTGSVFWRLVGGSNANISSITHRLAYYLSPSGSTNINATQALPTSARLSSQRAIVSGTTAGTLAGGGQLLLIWSYSNGAAIDFTIRIGWPQVEAGAIPSSPIRTTSAAVTRSADVLTRSNLDSFINADEGTLYWEGVVPYAASGVTQRLLALDDGTANEVVLISLSGTTLAFTVSTGGVQQASISLGTYTQGTKIKVAGRYKANDFQAAINGSLGTPDTSGSVAAVTGLKIGHRASGSDPAFAVHGKVGYLPRAVSDAQLQAMTA